MILEGIMTTLHADGTPNIAPLGPRVDSAFETMLLRPFQDSDTFTNLKRTRQGVFHVVDDVELLARAAVDRLEHLPDYFPAETVEGVILSDACRWYALEVTGIDESAPRAEMQARVVAAGRQRDFFGFNRAKHAVVEAAIVATRVGILPADEILAELARLASPVEKTGGDVERRAFEFLCTHVHERLGVASARAAHGSHVS